MTGTRKSPQLKESDIQAAITDLLQLDGWRPLRTDPCSDRARGKGFGEKGMADHLYIRYLAQARIVYPGGFATLKAPAAECLWIEHKRSQGRVSPHQREWHAAERRRGALTLIAGEDFPASVDGFLEFYRKSGLMRKDIRL